MAARFAGHGLIGRADDIGCAVPGEDGDVDGGDAVVIREGKDHLSPRLRVRMTPGQKPPCQSAHLRAMHPVLCLLLDYL